MEDNRNGGSLGSRGRYESDYSPTDRSNDDSNMDTKDHSDSDHNNHRDKSRSRRRSSSNNRKRDRDRDYSPRDRDYSPRDRRDRERDYSPRDRDYSPRERRDRDRDYSPRGRRDRDRGYSPRGRRDRDRDYSPRDRRDRDRDYSPRDRRDRDRDYSPRGRRNRDRDYSPRDRRDRDRDYSPRDRREDRSRDLSPNQNSSKSPKDLPEKARGPDYSDNRKSQSPSEKEADTFYNDPWDTQALPMASLGDNNGRSPYQDRSRSARDNQAPSNNSSPRTQQYDDVDDNGGYERPVHKYDKNAPHLTTGSNVFSQKDDPNQRYNGYKNGVDSLERNGDMKNTKQFDAIKPKEKRNVATILTAKGNAALQKLRNVFNRSEKDGGKSKGDEFTNLESGQSPWTEEKPPIRHNPTQNGLSSASQGSMVTLEWSENGGDKKELIYGEDENEERGNWSGRFDFILSMLGYAVGLGNVWRFPYLCYRNGGGAFLFPFLLMMVIIGLPLFYLEASLGQFSSCGAMTCWHFAPIFKGVGIGMVMVSAMTGIYYNMILGWALRYLFASFTSDIPFASCDNDWNTQDCKLKLPVMTCEGESKSKDGLCLSENGRELGVWNRTLFTEATGRKLVSPAKEYWDYVLAFSPGIEEFGQPKWDLVLCLLLAWIICFFCLIKGIKTTGKVVYFTAIFPYVVLFILFFRGVTLENAGLGVSYFITPQFDRLLDANVWKDAANQIFFSMSIAGGGLITLSSYNRFHNNILRDSLIVAIGDSLTCVLGGFVIFSFLGYMAGQLEVDIEDVAADGAGLAFVVYPEAVSSLPPTTLWSLLFFFMLLTLGLDSQFAMIETVLTGVLDQFPALRPKKTLVILIICCILFILGLPLASPGGIYLLQLMDNYVGGLTLIILAFVELVAVVFIYGVTRFCTDINLMTGSTGFMFWKVTWCCLSPLTILFIFCFMFVDLKPSTYDEYTYPAWADAIGWLFTMSSVLAVPIYAVFLICKETEGKSLWQKFRLLCLPSVYWGPALQKHRRLVTYVRDFQIDPKATLKSPNTRPANFVNKGYESDGLDTPRSKSDESHSLRASRTSVLTRSSCTKDSFESNV